MLEVQSRAATNIEGLCSHQLVSLVKRPGIKRNYNSQEREMLMLQAASALLDTVLITGQRLITTQSGLLTDGGSAVRKSVHRRLGLAQSAQFL